MSDNTVREWCFVLPLRIIFRIFTDSPQRMAHLAAVVVADDLGFPIAPHNLQRIVVS